MEGMFEIEVMSDSDIITIAVSIGMGIRVMPNIRDVDHCWICLADNSTWKSPDDYRTTVDKISGILRHL